MAKRNIFKFYLVTNADQKNLPPPPRGYEQPIICESGYQTTIQEMIKAAVDWYVNGTVSKMIYMKNGHAHIFVSVPDDCNKNLQENLDTYVGYSVSNMPYELQEKKDTSFVNPSNIGQSPSRSIIWVNKPKNQS